jgi:NADPH:quinone reductase-like Zn-dependent oxidoreductase
MSNLPLGYELLTLLFHPQVVGGSSAVGATSVELLRLALPETIILATCSEPHHSRVVDLGADKAFDPKSSDVLEAIRNASPGGDGVEAILDVVNGVAVQPALLELLTGPKLFAELLTGANIDTKAIPNGVTHRVAGLMNIIGKPHAENVFPSLTGLLVGGKFKLPVRVEVAGKGFDAIEPALKRLMGGVSGTKLVVSV